MRLLVGIDYRGSAEIRVKRCHKYAGCLEQGEKDGSCHEAQWLLPVSDESTQPPRHAHAPALLTVPTPRQLYLRFGLPPFKSGNPRDTYRHPTRAKHGAGASGAVCGSDKPASRRESCSGAAPPGSTTRPVRYQFVVWAESRDRVVSEATRQDTSYLPISLQVALAYMLNIADCDETQRLIARHLPYRWIEDLHFNRAGVPSRIHSST